MSQVTALLAATENNNNEIRRHSEDVTQLNKNRNGFLSINGNDIPRRKSSASRFQVTKSSDENSVMLPGTSATEALLPSNNNLSPDAATSGSDGLPGLLGHEIRKVSSAGRFKIFTEVENNDSPTLPKAESAPPQEDASTSSPQPEPIGKTVHFSVAEKDDENYDTIGSLNMDSTLMNAKSWRHQATLEHPPIIDFYRNTIDADSERTARPSMMQLLHGENASKSDLHDFKEMNVNIVETQMEIPKSSFKNSKSSKLETFQPPPTTTPRSKFGWIEGVFFRCILNIFGVMLYLRVSWVAGQAGILLGTCVVLLASLVTTITALSTCAICTNGDVKGGGAYFLISRSLGPEFGGSIGLIFSVANAVGAAMYVVGFAETVRDLLREYGITLIEGEMNDVRLIGLATCIILICIVFIGTGFESKMQMGLLVILTLSILDYFLGTLIPTSDEKRLRGLTGYSAATMSDNLLPNFRDGYNFFTVFSIYFPAATGIMAGANISGDLADPQKAIPLGTLSAIFLTTLVYILTIWTTGSTCVRDADGINFPEFDSNSTSYFQSYAIPECAANSSCPYGLMNYFQVMETGSLWGPLITAGIFAATLSSALASLVSAPKIFQAVCKDRLFPYITAFAKGSGKDEEPRRAYLLGFGISMIMILIGDLNAIAPIISNFFLCSYALINYACFDNSFAESPGFRPAFKFYNMWVSLVGALLCISVMFVVSWSTALLTFIFFAALYFYLVHRKPDVNWGSSTQAHTYRNALLGLIKLENTIEHVKNFRPQVLVLTGNPAARPSLVDFAYNITRGNSLMICGHVVPYPPCDYVFHIIRKLNFELRNWLKKRHIKSFYVAIANSSFRAGTQCLFQLSGLGRLKPNIVMLGFKQDWASDSLEATNEYFGLIQDSFDSGMSVMVLRNAASGLDFSDMMREQNIGDVAKLKIPEVVADEKLKQRNASDASKEQPHSESPEHVEHLEHEEDADFPLDLLNDEDLIDEEDFIDEEEGEGSDENYSHSEGSSNDKRRDPSTATEYSSADEVKIKLNSNEKIEKDIENGLTKPASTFERRSLIRRRREKQSTRNTILGIMSSRRLTTAQRELLSSINRFQRKIKKGRIDVWWLYDDGGLTLLIPYLLTQPKSYLENAELRVFTISTSASGMEQEARNMAALLSKFRINFSDVMVIPDVHKKPQASTLKEFERMIESCRCHINDKNYHEGMITEAELNSQKEKTKRQLRISELLKQHSSESDLIVLTLPVPRKGLISSCLYMAWIDMMTKNLPPTLLVRGNQTSVLTFYS